MLTMIALMTMMTTTITIGWQRSYNYHQCISLSLAQGDRRGNNRRIEPIAGSLCLPSKHCAQTPLEHASGRLTLPRTAPRPSRLGVLAFGSSPIAANKFLHAPNWMLGPAVRLAALFSKRGLAVSWRTQKFIYPVAQQLRNAHPNRA